MVLVALAVLIGPVLIDPSRFLSTLLGVLVAVCGIELAEGAVVGVFLSGFHQIHAGRHEYGLVHARSVDRALVYLVVFAALTVGNGVYTLTAGILGPSVPEVPMASLFIGNVVLGPLGALFAGLTLWETARRIADPLQARRLRTALVLGVAGTLAGPLLRALAEAPGSPTVSSLVGSLLVSAIAGEGVAAVSLLLFALVFRQIRRELEAGRPAPALPRLPPAYPYGWVPVPPGPPPAAGGPPQPPRP